MRNRRNRWKVSRVESLCGFESRPKKRRWGDPSQIRRKGTPRSRSRALPPEDEGKQRREKEKKRIWGTETVMWTKSEGRRIALNVYRSIFKVMPCLTTRSQWSCFRMGVMWWRTRAAEFWTWSYFCTMKVQNCHLPGNKSQPLLRVQQLNVTAPLMSCFRPNGTKAPVLRVYLLFDRDLQGLLRCIQLEDFVH